MTGSNQMKRSVSFSDNPGDYERGRLRNTRLDHYRQFVRGVAASRVTDSSAVEGKVVVGVGHVGAGVELNSHAGSFSAPQLGFFQSARHKRKEEGEQEPNGKALER